MSIDKIRMQVKASVWQGIAQSGVDLSAVPSDQQTKLVDGITNSVLHSVDDVLEEAHKGQSAGAELLLGDDEKIIWEGRPYLSMVEFYALTTERLKIVKGLFGKDTENIELIRIQDIDITQNLSERIFNIGDIAVRGADPSNPSVVLRNVSDPQKVYDIMRKAWLSARKRYGLQFREEM
jgi:hypothetical protein